MNTPKTILLIGEPASGKTTIIKALMDRFTPRKKFRYGLVRGEQFDNVHFIGVYDGDTFDGSDKLSMAVQPDFDAFTKSMAGNSIIVIEGDRLSSEKTIQNTSPHIFAIVASEESKQRRREERGNKQSQKFIQAKATKIKNISERHQVNTLSNDTNDDLISIVDYLYGIIKTWQREAR